MNLSPTNKFDNTKPLLCRLVVELHPTNNLRNSDRKNRFQTPFLEESKVDGSPISFEVSGRLARDIRRDALAVGKEPEAYAVEGLVNWYCIEGVFAR